MSFEKIAELESFETSAVVQRRREGRAAMAEAMCERSVTVPDAVFEEVRRHFDEKAIVELVVDDRAGEHAGASSTARWRFRAMGCALFRRIIRRCEAQT